MSEGRAPRRCHSDRGILEQYDGKFIKKVPQTSVAPTYKLTLPSEFVAANLSHLIDQAFDLTDQDGSDTWKVALLPRRNKSKFEYTLQGWKAFALSHSVRSGDRLQIELLPDGRRMRADIVKRATPKDKACIDPVSPAVLDIISATKPSSDEPSLSTSVDGSGGAPLTVRGRMRSLGSEPSSGLSRLHGSPSLSRPPSMNGDALHISSALLQHATEQLQRHSGNLNRADAAAVMPGRQPERHAGSPAAARAFGRWQGPSRVVHRHMDEAHGADVAIRDADMHDSMEGPDSLSAPQVRGIHHPKRPRSVFQQMASPLPPFRDSKRQAGSAEYNLVLSRGMQLLTSAAGLDAEPEPEPEQERQPMRQQPLQATLSSNGGGAGIKAEPSAAEHVLREAERALEAETSRGLIVVSALLRVAERLGSPDLLARAGGPAAGELCALHAELKEHTNSVLDAMCHLRGLPKTWKQA